MSQIYYKLDWLWILGALIVEAGYVAIGMHFGHISLLALFVIPFPLCIVATWRASSNSSAWTRAITSLSIAIYFVISIVIVAPILLLSILSALSAEVSEDVVEGLGMLFAQSLRPCLAILVVNTTLAVVTLCASTIRNR